MLQQTQVATVIPYWHRWLERFPTVESLAAAEEQDALSLWQGLGYYRRCRLLLRGARWVVEHGVPKTAREWEGVPGVGRYTAGAIASISVDDPSPLVDGNVERVYARVAGVYATGTSLHRNAWEWADRELNRERPGDWNQALMELGATVCRPLRPECPLCPLEGSCFARQNYATDELPVRPPKAEPVHLHHVVWVPIYGESFGLRQVPPGLWWQGMWEFPRAEAIGGEEPPELRELVGSGWLESLGTIRHGVTKHRIKIDASLVRCKTPSPALRWVKRDGLAELPIPAPQRKVLALALQYLGS